MMELGIDLFDEEARTRIEHLQWQLAQELLRLDNRVIIEWGLWRPLGARRAARPRRRARRPRGAVLLGPTPRRPLGACEVPGHGAALGLPRH